MRKKITLILLIIFILSGCTNSEKSTVSKITSMGTPIVEKNNSNNISWDSSIDSSCFSKIGYDEENEVLYVEFLDSGSEYRYLGFSYYDWLDFRASSSLGQYYNQNIKEK